MRHQVCRRACTLTPSDLSLDSCHVRAALGQVWIFASELLEWRLQVQHCVWHTTLTCDSFDCAATCFT